MRLDRLTFTVIFGGSFGFSVSPSTVKICEVSGETLSHVFVTDDRAQRLQDRNINKGKSVSISDDMLKEREEKPGYREDKSAA